MLDAIAPDALVQVFQPPQLVGPPFLGDVCVGVCFAISVAS